MKTLRAAICGRNLEGLRRLLAKSPVSIVKSKPDLVISYGGDGALLGAERDFPGIPKLPLRDSCRNPQCPAHGEEKILGLLVRGRLKPAPLLKLEAACGGHTLTAVNDIVLHNRVTTSAIRYRIWLDGELYANRIVGDGLVAATPFGSTGYYRSITHSIFKLGVGLAFNNSTEPTDHLVIRDDTVIRVEILRGPAVLLADNCPASHTIHLKRHDTVVIRKSPQTASILGLEAFRCPACARLRQENPDAM